MSLPATINPQDENFFVPESLLTDPDLLYLYSLRDTDGLSEKSLTIDGSEALLQTPLDSYNMTVSFGRGVYEKMRSESQQQIENKSNMICKGLKNSMEEFHIRGAIQLATTLTEKIYNPFALSADFNGIWDNVKEIAISPMMFHKLPGTNPSKWPIDLPTLVQKLEELPPLTFFKESLEFHEDFFQKAQNYIDDTINLINKNTEKNKVFLDDLLNACQAISLIHLLSGNLINLFKIMELIKSTSSKLSDNFEFLNKISFYLLPHFSELRCLSESPPKLHFLRSLCDCGGFKIAKTAHFQKQSFQTTSLTTDGIFLYLYVSASNGGMYKIGTLEGGNIAGKIYLFTAVTRQDEVSWVFCKGKLYLRSSSKEFGNIEIICPNTFKTEGFIQLYCPEIFGHPSLQLINKNYPLLTDGEYLYIIGKKLISEKINNEEEKPKETKIEEKKIEIEVEKKPVSAALIEEKHEELEIPAQKIALESEKILENINEIKQNMENFIFAKDDSDPLPLPSNEPDFEDIFKFKSENQPPQPPQPDKVEKIKQPPLKKREEKKKKEKKPEVEENTLKLCEFILYEFDLASCTGNGLELYPENRNHDNKELIQELYESFSGLFTYNECVRALFINKDDISTAAQWLVDEGEKERTKKTVMVRNSTLLSQAEIVSDISNKNLKNNAEILTRDDSLIHPSNVSGNIWTMNRDQITLYTETGIKIFSKNPKDVKIMLNVTAQGSDCSSEPPSMFKPSTFSSINADFYKRNKEIIIEESDILEKILEKDHFLLKYTLFLKNREENNEKDLPEDIIFPSFAAGRFFKPDSSPPNPPKLLKSESKSRKSIPLKGSHIKTIEASKKGFYTNANYHITYDNSKKKFYIMNWSWNSYTNVFPSLITISYDYNDYEEADFHQPLRGVRKVKGSYLSSLNASPEKEKINNSPVKEQKDWVRFDDVLETLNEILIRVMLLQKKRFGRPWKLNSWEYMIGNGLVELNNKKAVIDNNKDNEEERKKISSQKNKLIARLNKFLANKKQKNYSNKKILQENKKVYSHCMDGSFETLNYLWNFINDLLRQNIDEMSLKLSEHLFLLLQFLLYWVKHSDVLSHYNNNLSLFSEISQIIYSKLESPEKYHSYSPESLSRKTLNLLWFIIIQGWEHFVYETSLQIQWITLILDYSVSFSYKNTIDQDFSDLFGYSPLAYLTLKIGSLNNSINYNFPFKESLIELFKNQDELLINADNNTNFFNYFRKFRVNKAQENSFSEPLGRILNLDLNYLFHVKAFVGHFEDYYPDYFINVTNKDKNIETPLRKESKNFKDNDFNKKITIENSRILEHKDFSEKIWNIFEKNLILSFEKTNNIEGLFVWKLFLKLFVEAWLDLTKIEDGFFEAIYNTKLYNRLLNLLLSVISVFQTKIEELFQKQPQYLSKLLENLSKLINFLGYMLIQSNMMKYNTFTQEILQKQLTLFSKLKDFTKFGSKTGNNLLQDIFPTNSEGIDQLSEKIFETNHPYERGKGVSFDQIHYPGALAICVELDKRCQSDTTNDYLVIAGWYSHHISNMGLQMSPRDGLGTCYRISGRPNLKRPIVLLGNTAQIEFSSSGHAKDELSLNRWGFKLTVKAIYGSRKKLFSKDIDKNFYQSLVSKFGSEAYLTDWIHSLRLFSLVNSQIVEKSLRGDRIQIREIENYNVLKWNLLRKGLQNVKITDFLEKKDGKWFSKDYKIDNKFILNETDNDCVSFANDDFDNENQPHLKKLLKGNPELKSEFKEDSFQCLKKELFSRIQKERLSLPDEIQLKTNHKKSENPLLSQDIESKIESIEDNNIKTWVQEILVGKGEHYDLLLQIKSLVREPLNLQGEKRRPTFSKELQKKWIFAENLTILTMLHHNKTLKITFGASEMQYFKEQFRQMAIRKNEILEWMISQVQNEREWQFAIQELLDIKKEYLGKLMPIIEKSTLKENSKIETENIKTKEILKKEGKKIRIIHKKIKKQEEEKKTIEEKEEETKNNFIKPEIDEKLDKDLWSVFQKRYENNYSSIKSLCSLKSIQYNPEDPNTSLKEFYKVALEAISTQESIVFESPYEIISATIIQKLFFLLNLNNDPAFSNLILISDIDKKINSPNKQLSGEINLNLAPIGLERSVSCQVEEKIDREKLESFRQWIDSYQKWKVWQHKEDNEINDLENENCTSNKLIYGFLCSKINVNEIELCLRKNNIRAGQRVSGLYFMIDFHKIVENTILEKYILGAFVEFFKFDCFSNIKCASKQFKDIFLEPFVNNLKSLIHSFNEKFTRIYSINLNSIVTQINKIKAGKKLNEDETVIKEFLKIIYLNLSEICSLFSCKIPFLVHSTFDKWLDIGNFGEIFYRNILNLGLLCKSLSLISNNFEDLTYLLTNLSQIIWLLSTKISQHMIDPINLSQISEYLLDCIEKEFGFVNKNAINIRLLARMIDFTGINRLEFLLNNFEDFLRFHEKRLQNKTIYLETLQKRVYIFLVIVYFSNHPGIVRIILRILRILINYVDILDVQTIYDLTYYTKIAINYEELQKNPLSQHKYIPPTMLLKNIQYGSTQSLYPINFLSILSEKIGQNILMQSESEKGLRTTIEQELSKFLKDNEYSKNIANKLINSISIISSSESGIQEKPEILSRNSSSTSSLHSALQKTEKKQRETVVLIQLNNEEDISFLVFVLYFWESLHPTFSLKYPKTIEEYLRQKEEKQKKETELKNLHSAQNLNDKPLNQIPNQNQPQNPPIYSQKIYEKLFVNLPDFNLIDDQEKDMPFGWFFNYMGLFPDMKGPKQEQKMSKPKKTVKKLWTNANLVKLERKFEGLNKTIEEFKETDSDEDKLQIINARNFISRINHHISQVKNIAVRLNVYGFSPIVFSNTITHKKALELGYLIQLGINNLLKPINIEYFKEELRKKIDPYERPPPANPPAPNAQPAQLSRSNTKAIENIINQQKSQIVITLCDYSIYQNFDSTVDFVNSLTSNKDNFYIDCNKFSILHRFARSGSSTCTLIYELVDFLRYWVQLNPQMNQIYNKFINISLDNLSKEDRWSILSQYDKNIGVGLGNIIGGWSQSIRNGAIVSIRNQDHENLCTIIQGGYISGKKQCTLISNNDPNLIIQTVNSEDIDLRHNTNWLLQGNNLNTVLLLDSIRNIYKLSKQKGISIEELINYELVLRSLLQVAISLDWNILLSNKDLLQILMLILHDLCKNCPADKSFLSHQLSFVYSWEKLIDKLDPSSQIFSIPSSFESNQSYEFELERKSLFPSKSSDKTSSESWSALNFVLPNSSYIDSLPEQRQNVSEHKMLKFWEKHIIPRIQDFVRSSYKPWEFEDFFEQLRQPLRKGDQAKAAEVAYILCDNRLPAGVVLPDVNHDWQTISIEEVTIGQWAVAKLMGKNNCLYSPFFNSQYKLGNTEICVQMLAIDSKSSSVLVLYQDHENLQLLSIWLPVTSIKNPEIPMNPHVSCLNYEKIINEFQNNLVNDVSLLSRHVLLKFFTISGEDLSKEEKILKEFNLPMIEIIKWSVLEELSEDPVEGWLEINDLNNSKESDKLWGSKVNITNLLQIKKENKYPKLFEIELFLKWFSQNESRDFTNIQNLFDWTKSTFPLVCDFISNKSVHVNLYRASLENNNLPFSINYFEGIDKVFDSMSAVCLSFRPEAILCLCSGVKFYSDENGINTIYHIQAGKEDKTKLKPLVFKMGNVWCNYYFNAEALPPYLQNQNKTNIPTQIYGIPSMWCVCCWITDSLGSAFMNSSRKDAKENLAEINRFLIVCFEKLQGPHNIRELLAKLIIRNTRRLHRVIYRNQIHIDEDKLLETIGVNKEFIIKLIDEINKLKESQSLDLYFLNSSYLQELMELVITLILPYKPNLKNPISELLIDPLNKIYKIGALLNYIREETSITSELQKEVLENIKIDNQIEHIIYIEHIPLEWSIDYIKTNIIQIIEKNKGRILIPSLDIQIPTINDRHIGICIIILDGWAVLDIEDVVNTVEKNEEPPQIGELIEVEEEEKNIEPLLWSCEVCTLENSDESNVCAACEAPRPEKPLKPSIEMVPEIPRPDLSEVEKEIQKKDKARFDKVLDDINNFVKEFWEKKKTVEIENEKKKEKENKIAEEQVIDINSKKEKNKNQKKKLKEEKNKLKQEIILKRQEKKVSKKQKKKNLDQLSNKNPIEIIKEENKEIVEKDEKLDSLPPPAIESDQKDVNQNAGFNLPQLESPLKKDQNQIDPLKSPEFSRSTESKTQCIVLFGRSIFEKKSASIHLNKIFGLRLLSSDSTKFKNSVKIILKHIYEIFNKPNNEELKEKVLKMFNGIDLTNFETYLAHLFSMINEKAIEIWFLLEFFGYDFWLNNAAYNQKERPNFVPIKIMIELMKYLEIDLCQETKAILTYSPLNIRLMNRTPIVDDLPIGSLEKPINYFNEQTLENKYFLLYRYPLREIRYTWSLLKIFNASLITSIQYINMKVNEYNYDNIWLSLSTYLSAFRDLWMMPIKIDLTHKVLQKTALPRDEVPKITLERLKMNREINKFVPKDGISLKNKDDFIFSRSHDQLKDISTTLLRPIKPQGAEPHICFEIIFKGENVMGEAGPYRQYFADISSELQPNSVNPSSNSKNLHLLCPSPNNDAKLGRGRDKFVINPSAKSSYHLQLFEFLGILMGCSVRTGTHLTLDLPTLFWKQLVGQKIEFEDLEEVDESLKDLVNIVENYGRTEFEQSIMETFTTILSNKSEVELKKGGAKIQVTYENRFEYIYRVIQTRIKENILQIEAIKKGLCKIIPLPFLNCISAKDLEIWVCGKSKVNFELLKRHTRYSGGLTEDSPVIKNLWEVLIDLKENEKLRFVKFCWGQERLPANDEEFERTQIRFMIKPAGYEGAEADKALPKADTCFFNLQLPNYSTKERILLAINTDCDSMNAEDPRNLDGNIPNGEREGDSSYDQEEE